LIRPGGGKRRARFILPGLYLLLAAYVWFDFTRTNPDGLANLGLMLVTLPVTLIGLALGALAGADKFVLLPHGFGYIGDHALYFFPAAAGTAALIWLIGRAIDRRPN
jgi:hypothetical protein